MAAGAESAPVVQYSPNTDIAIANANGNGNSNAESAIAKDSDPKSEIQMQDIVDMLSKLKLNPLAKEFFPSSYLQDRDQFAVNNFSPAKDLGIDGYPNNRRVTEEQLAALFSSKCGQVVDCRICGDPHSRLRFAFVEFADERCARDAINLSGTIIGFYPIRVLPSKTAILPVNPTFLPRSQDEREMCARTVYCTNIDKLVSRLRLLGDNVHSTRIAFVEFAMAESAIAALNCSGRLLGTQPIRVSPSKTPVRPRLPRPELH
ncbi:hypothetical protein Acr_17g0008920 [Actinidia rufa]|uniref:RRM domain-containing protein n=1 Tax=Actinidia rufa TaxID=165716 RepID=A0A7J0G3G6_9ERIC|nr:hypothetical protein Acr_17g0008920 [Actinidia rufa]